MEDLKSKDHKFGFLSKTNAYVSDAICLDQVRIYAIFYRNGFFEFHDDATIYQNISNSQFHAFASWPTVLPYTYLVKWVIFADVLTSYFRDANKILFMNTKADTFAKMY